MGLKNEQILNKLMEEIIMDLLKMKVITFKDIVSKEHLTKAEKIQLLNFVKEASDIQLGSLLETGRMKTEKEILQEQPGDAAGRAQAAKDALARAHQRYMQKYGADSGRAASSLSDKAKEVASQAAAKGKELAGQAATVAKSAGEKVASTTSNVVQQAGGIGPVAGYAAIAAGAIVASIIAYKRFFSKAARACKGLSGSQKTSCMKKYKIGAKQAEMGILTARINKCKGDPKCVARIRARIQKVKTQQQSLKQ